MGSEALVNMGVFRNIKNVGTFVILRETGFYFMYFVV